MDHTTTWCVRWRKANIPLLRLKYQAGLSNREIARRCGIAHPTVAAYLERARRAGVSWPVPEELDEDRLERLLYPNTPPSGQPSRPLPTLPTSIGSCGVRM